MIESMNQEKFLVEVKEKRCFSDWHRRYYARQARKYHRIDYWLKSIIGVLALIGAIMTGFSDWRMFGAFLAATCAIIISNVLPRFKWDDIVSGFKEEEEEWMRIFKGYEDVISFTEISDRGEILLQEYQRIVESQKASALNSRKLPSNQKVWDECDKEIRDYYNLPQDPYKTIENKGENK
jgi:hypothetical protein